MLACSNASGTFRLLLVVINKSTKPRCFKHMDMKSLPVVYMSQKKSWMDCKLFSEWFAQHFVPAVRRFCREKGLDEKALLLLDNAPSHPSTATLQSPDGKIKAMFLPPNTTSIVQPIDQGVLDPCKRRYKLLSQIVLEEESEDKSVPELLKAVTMKDVVYWIADAWKEATDDSLRKAWKNLLPESTGSESSSESAARGDQPTAEAAVDDPPVADIVDSVRPDMRDAVAEWMEADTNEPGHQILSDDEIVAEVVVSEEEGDGSDEDEGEPVPPTVTPSAAFDALGVSLRWLESQHVDAEHLLLVKKWRDHGARMRRESLRQRTITSFFTVS